MKSNNPKYITIRFFQFLVIILSGIYFSACSSSSETQSSSESADTTSIEITPVKSSKDIRVLLDGNLPKNEIAFAIPVSVLTGDSTITSAAAKEKIKFELDNNLIRLKIGKKSFNGKYFDFVSQTNRSLTYNKQNYAGKLRLIIYGSQFGIVNVVGLDEYIKGVIAAELGKLVTFQNIEAVKANAICVRNYSLLKISEAKDAYDAFDDVRDQIYNGVVKSNAALDSAVLGTKNQVLKFGNELANVFYFSSCGGFTEDCAHVFPKAADDYLKGVKDGDGPYCKLSPSFKWEETFSKKQILSLLEQANYLDGKDWDLIDISIASRYESDRVNELNVFVDNKNNETKTIVLKGNLIRSVFKTQGKNLLKSTMFDVATKKKSGEIEQVKFVGKGNGHGVGLCQWGAIGQAKAGKNYKEILSFYFPGTSVETLND